MLLPTSLPFLLGAEVEQALHENRPVVALESTIITHGLPRPVNARVAAEIEDVVRSQGAVPATIALLRGRIQVGLSADQLNELAADPEAIKVSVRDIAMAMATATTGATTVAATAHLAHLAGICVFATGGIGGVHRDARTTWDESADLTTLAHTPITVISSGIKSILDVAATLERLETLGIGVCGYQTRRTPGFYLTELPHELPTRLESAAQVASVMRARRLIADPAALLVFQPLPADRQMDPALHDVVLQAGLFDLAQRGISGKDVTPALLEYFRDHTEGESLRVNIELILANASLAAQIAAADTDLDRQARP